MSAVDMLPIFVDLCGSDLMVFVGCWVVSGLNGLELGNSVGSPVTSSGWLTSVDGEFGSMVSMLVPLFMPTKLPSDAKMPLSISPSIL